MNVTIRFLEWEFECLYHDMQTDKVSFRVESDGDVTEDDKRRVIDAMVKAGTLELCKIEKERKESGDANIQQGSD